jgi:glutamate/tyrosine decarboxylase-like PLP-dependent enzyme
MMDWTARAFGLPSHFIFEATKGVGGGCLHATASEAIFSVVIAARHWALEKLGCYPTEGERKLHPGEPLQKLVCYTSCETHSSTQKGANLALTPIRILTPNDKYQITGEILEEAIKKDIAAGFIPYLVVASIGSTGGVCFDELATIGPIARKYDMWMHVDGAYGGNSYILPELQHLKYGLEYADSIEINPYKMINSGLEISCLFLRDVEQYKKPWIINATYLIDESESESDKMLKTNNIEYRHYGVALSRKMRALKLWFLFRAYGLTGLRERVRNMIKLAKYFEKLVRADDRFEVTNFVELGVVCFSQRENAESRRADASRSPDDAGPTFRVQQNMNLLWRCNKSKKIHLCPCTLKGVYSVRVSVNYPYQTEKDMLRAWTVIQSLYVTTLDKEMEQVLGGSTEESERAPSGSFVRPLSAKHHTSRQ